MRSRQPEDFSNADEIETVAERPASATNRDRDRENNEGSPSRSERGRSGRRLSSHPEVSFSERPAGRETLGAIAEESSFPRAPEATRIYGDRISNAPGAPSPKTARALDDQPDIVVSVQPAGRQTFAVIERELGEEPPDIEIDGDADQPRHVNMGALAIEQMYTFLVKAPLTALEAPQQQRRLVEHRLLPHLPVRSFSEVSSVDVRPWQEPGTLLVRVWCQIP